MSMKVRKKRKSRKNYNRWVHFKVKDHKLFGFESICGRTTPQCEHPRTTNIEEVTCPRCIELLKQKEDNEKENKL